MRPYLRLWLCIFCWLPSLTVMAEAGFTQEVRLSTRAHAPSDAPDVVVHGGASLRSDEPFDVVVFLHGFDGCARALVAEAAVACARGEPPHRVWNLGALHAAANTRTLLIVPQLAYLARTAQDHRFLSHGGFDATLTEILEGSLASQLGAQARSRVRSVALVAHSAGYGAAAAILRDPKRKMPVTHVVLLDALYAGASVFADWARSEPSARLVSLYTQQEKTTAGNRLLLKQLATADVATSADPSLAQVLKMHRHLIARVRTAHGDMPRVHFTEVLRALFDVPAPS